MLNPLVKKRSLGGLWFHKQSGKNETLEPGLLIGKQLEN